VTETIIAEFEVASPSVVLGPTLARDLDVTVHAERLPVSDGETTWFHVQVHSGEFQAFERALTEDSTVADASLFVTHDETSRTYRLTIADEVPVMTATVAAIGEELLDLRSSGDGWRVQIRTTDRASIRAFTEFCGAHDIDCELRELYRSTAPVGTVAVPLDTDDAELLQEALEAGYFEVPRETSLEALATTFDCSESTLSVRLRRATRDILREVLGGSGGDKGPTSSE